jgi:tripartite-type tricarboxylate transporter receptor subunit TctC
MSNHTQSRGTISRRAVLKTAALVTLPALSVSVAAQAFPARPITLICPWPAGGSTDIVMRAIAESAGKALGQTMIIDNKPGAGGTLGAVAMLSAKPDGYTLSQAPMGIFRIPHMQKTAFHPLNDLSYVINMTGYTFGLVVRADSPFKDIKDLVAFAKANPEKLTYGNTGAGTTPHMAVEDFAQKAGIKLTPVPFKGNADNMQAVLGGHVMAASDATGWGPHVDAGKLRLLATYGTKRTKKWPNIPTLHELGYDTISDSPFGIMGPKGMDAATTKILHDAFKKSLDDANVQATFEKYDQPTIYMNSADYTAWAKRMYEGEKALIERLGLKG